MKPVGLRSSVIGVTSLALACGALWPLREFVETAGTRSGNLSRARPAGSTPLQWTGAAMPGAMRALTADGLWLKVYAAWAVRDLPRTEALLRWVTAVDDRPISFWLNGARIIAYDVTEWKLSALDDRRVPLAVRRRVIEAQACAALDHLAAAQKRHPESAAIWVEMGNIHLYRRGDLPRAADCYRRAAESPNAPAYAARVHAELLRRLGRAQEADVWLRRLHPTLPADGQTPPAIRSK